MADWAKIAIKTGLIVGVMAGIWAVFNLVQVPTVDFSVLTQGLGTSLAVLNHWLPVFSVILPVTLALFALEAALLAFRFGAIAVRWLFKVNE